jgi:hypothetical protein
MLYNKVFLKSLIILSSILGLVLGLVTIVPFVCNFSFFALMVLSAPLLLIYIKKIGQLGTVEPKQGAIYGAIIGFVTFIGFSVSFMPLATIIGFLYKGSYYLGISLLFRSGVFVMIMMVLFVAILCSLMNAFSGLVTAYVYKQIEPVTEEQFTSIDIQE